jgi:glycosyltransferase involved in cell wall biosynthesis
MFETTGLVSLEAALSGCNVVSTVAGYAREYLQDLVSYCEPHDVTSIRDAVLTALSSPQQTGLRQRILDNYTWEHAASATAAAYYDLLNRRLNL